MQELKSKGISSKKKIPSEKEKLKPQWESWGHTLPRKQPANGNWNPRAGQTRSIPTTIPLSKGPLKQSLKGNEFTRKWEIAWLTYKVFSISKYTLFLKPYGCQRQRSHHLKTFKELKQMRKQHIHTQAKVPDFTLSSTLALPLFLLPLLSSSLPR